MNDEPERSEWVALANDVAFARAYVERRVRPGEGHTATLRVINWAETLAGEVRALRKLRDESSARLAAVRVEARKDNDDALMMSVQIIADTHEALDAAGLDASNTGLPKRADRVVVELSAVRQERDEALDDAGRAHSDWEEMADQLARVRQEAETREAQIADFRRITKGYAEDNHALSAELAAVRVQANRAEVRAEEQADLVKAMERAALGFRNAMTDQRVRADTAEANYRSAEQKAADYEEEILAAHHDRNRAREECDAAATELARLRGVLQQMLADAKPWLRAYKAGSGSANDLLASALAAVSGSANPKQEADEIPADLWRDNDEFGWTSFAKPNGPIHPQPRRGDASTYHRQVWRSGWHPLPSSSAGSVGETP